jgi:hypothetical protein
MSGYRYFINTFEIVQLIFLVSCVVIVEMIVIELARLCGPNFARRKKAPGRIAF